MPTQRLANIVFSISIIGACAYFAWVAQGFETSGLLAASGLPSKFFPQLMLAFIASCAGVVIWRYARHGGVGGDEGKKLFEDRGEARRGLLTLAVAGIAYAIWAGFGFGFMAASMGPASLIAMGVRSLGVHLTVLSLALLVYLVFTRLLGVDLG